MYTGSCVTGATVFGMTGVTGDSGIVVGSEVDVVVSVDVVGGVVVVVVGVVVDVVVVVNRNADTVLDTIVDLHRRHLGLGADATGTRRGRHHGNLTELALGAVVRRVGGRQHLWFVPVYLVVVSLTPVALAAHRRWGLMVPASLVAAVVVVDIAARIGHLPVVGSANYVLCWGAIYQLGICWRSGALGGRRPMLLAATAAAALAVLLVLRCYPVTMVGSPGAADQNNFPPNAALLAFAAVQTAVLVAAAPAVTRRLRRSRWQRPLAAANRYVMALYLWQMVPVVFVALIGYPTGLLPQPAAGTADWWLFRFVWLLILAVVAAVEMTLLWLGRTVFSRALPAIAAPLPAWSAPLLLAAGVATATFALSRIAVEGFAPDGRFPIWCALLFVAAVGLISLVPSRPRANTAAV